MATRKRRPQWRVGDEPILALEAKDIEGATMSLAGKAVKLRYKIGTAAAVERDASITDASAGLAQYQMTASDFTASGDILWEWEITSTGSPSRPIHGPAVPRRAQIIPVLS